MDGCRPCFGKLRGLSRRTLGADRSLRQFDDAVGKFSCFWPVRNYDSRNVQSLDGFVDHPLHINIKVARRFIHDQDLWPAIQGSRDEKALLLAAGKRGTHVTYQTVIAHRPIAQAVFAMDVLVR
jgi:hypothetical protein